MVVLAFTLLAAACGGDENGEPGVASLDDTVAPVSDGGSPAPDTEQQALQFATCMRDQGIDLPDPTVDADGNVEFVPPPGFQPGDLEDILDASENCQEFLEGTLFGSEVPDLTAATDVLLDFAQCIRENGFDLPDPDFSLVLDDPANAPAAGPFGDVDLNDPDLLAALGNCQDLLSELGIAGS